MNILYKVTTLVMLLAVAITAGAQTTPPDGTPVITLTVTNNATIIFSMSAAAEYTHAWVEAVPGTYTPTTIGTEPTEKSIRVTGTTLKIYGPITGLDCGGNKEMLTAIDVSQNTALTDLGCYTNQLTALNISKNTALKYLRCYCNQLSALDVSKNTALTRLDCGYNQLTALDVSQNTLLATLDFYSKPTDYPRCNQEYSTNTRKLQQQPD